MFSSSIFGHLSMFSSSVFTCELFQLNVLPCSSSGQHPVGPKSSKGLSEPSEKRWFACASAALDRKERKVVVTQRVPVVASKSHLT